MEPQPESGGDETVGCFVQQKAGERVLPLWPRSERKTGRGPPSSSAGVEHGRFI